MNEVERNRSAAHIVHRPSANYADIIMLIKTHAVIGVLRNFNVLFKPTRVRGIAAAVKPRFAHSFSGGTKFLADPLYSTIVNFHVERRLFSFPNVARYS